MAKQKLTEDGLPILTKPVSTQVTEDGLPILKKKESTTYESSVTPSVSPSTQTVETPVEPPKKEFKLGFGGGLESYPQETTEQTPQVQTVNRPTPVAPSKEPQREQFLTKKKEEKKPQNVLNGIKEDVKKMASLGIFNTTDLFNANSNVYAEHYLDDVQKEEYDFTKRVQLADNNLAKDPNNPDLQLASKSAHSDYNNYQLQRNYQIDQQIAELDAKTYDIADNQKKIATLKAQKESFFADKFKKAYSDNKNQIDELKIEGKTPKEQMVNYYLVLQKKAEQLQNKLYPNGVADVVRTNLPFGATDYEVSLKKQLDEVEGQLKQLSPVVLINRSPLKTDEGFWSTAAKKAINTMVPNTQGQLQTEQERADLLNIATTQAGIEPNAINKTVASNIEDKSKSEKAYSANWWGGLAGNSAGMIPQFMAGAAIVENVPAMARFNTAMSGSRWGRFISGATTTGSEYAAAGALAPDGSSLEGEGTFASGFLGSGISQVAMKGMNSKLVSSIFNSLFKDKAQVAAGIVSAAGKRVASGLGETGEEIGNSVGQLVDLYQQTGDWEQVKKQFNDQFGTPSKNMEFFLSTFIMGLAMGSGNQLGQTMSAKAKDQYDALSPDEKKQADAFMAETAKDVKESTVEATKEAVKEGATPPVNNPVTPEQKAEVEKAKEVITDENSTVEEKTQAANIINEVNAQAQETEIAKAMDIPVDKSKLSQLESLREEIPQTPITETEVTNDSKNIGEQIPSEVGIGQEPVQTKPIEEGGTTPISGSSFLQNASKEEKLKNLFNLPLNEVTADSTNRASSDFFDNVFKGNTSTPQLYSKLDIPTRLNVFSRMIGAIENDEIFRAIVPLIPVDMVNNLMGKNFSAEDLLGNKSVLIDFLSSNASPDVVSLVMDALKQVFASSGTKGFNSFMSRGRSEENIPALKTSQLVIPEVPSVFAGNSTFKSGGDDRIMESGGTTTTTELPVDSTGNGSEGGVTNNAIFNNRHNTEKRIHKDKEVQEQKQITPNNKQNEQLSKVEDVAVEVIPQKQLSNKDTHTKKEKVETPKIDNIPSEIKEPTYKQVMDDKANDRVVDFKYKTEDEIPQIFKDEDKVIRWGVGEKRYYTVHLSQSEADYYLAKEEQNQRKKKNEQSKQNKPTERGIDKKLSKPLSEVGKTTTQKEETATPAKVKLSSFSDGDIVVRTVKGKPQEFKVVNSKMNELKNLKTNKVEKFNPNSTSFTKKEVELKPIATGKGRVKAHLRKTKNPYTLQAQATDMHDAHGVVLKHFATGGKISANAIKEIMGDVNAEVNARMSYKGSNVNRHEKSVDAVAHNIFENLPEGSNIDIQDIRDAVEDVVINYTNPSQMAKKIDEVYHESKVANMDKGNAEIYGTLEDSRTEEQLDNPDSDAISDAVTEVMDNLTDEQLIEASKGNVEDDWLKGLDDEIIREEITPLSEKNFYKKYKSQHKDLASSLEERENTKNSILENGFRKGRNVNALPIYPGSEKSTDINTRHYGNKKGDVVYILPKEGTKSGPNGLMTTEGYKPSIEDIIPIEYNGQSVYEAYLHNIEKLNSETKIETPWDEKAINFFENLKVDNKNKLNAFGLAPAAWNTILDGIIVAIKGGMAVHQAIKDAIAKAKEISADFDEKGFTAKMDEIFGNKMEEKPSVKSIFERLSELNNIRKNGTLSEKKAASTELRTILDNNPNIDNIYQKLPEINKQLEQNGLLTKKGDCP